MIMHFANGTGEQDLACLKLPSDAISRMLRQMYNASNCSSSKRKFQTYMDAANSRAGS